MVHEVVEQHAEMAAFLWAIRGMAVVSHHYDLSDLGDLEERIDANLDGIRIAGEPGWEVAMAALGSKEPGAFFVAASGAIEARDLNGFAAVLDAMEDEEAALAGIEGALAWASKADALSIVESMLAPHQPPILRTLGLATCVAHRQDPGLLLEELLEMDRVDSKRLFARAAGELGRLDLGPRLKALWAADDPETRFRSLWSAGLLGLPEAARELWSLARFEGESAGDHRSPVAERAAEHAARLSPPQEGRRQIEALASWPAHERAAVVAAGALGDPALLPWLSEKLSVPGLSRLAAEAIAQTTGVVIEGPLRAVAPEGFREGPTDDPKDEDVAMSPDMQLPWPSVAALRALAAARSGGSGVRHCNGAPISDESLGKVLVGGTQRRRAGAAYDRAVRAPGRPLFDVTDRVARQARALAEAR